MQQEPSFVSNLLSQIAIEQKRPFSAVEPLIRVLEDNWFDSKEALQTASDADFEKLKIPMRMVTLIREAVAREVTLKEDDWDLELTRIATQINEEAQFKRTIGIIVKMLTSVLQNTLSPQFQQVALSSKTLQQNILAYPAATQLMKKLGWNIHEQYFKCQFSLDLQNKWESALASFEQVLGPQIQPPQGFDPYKASFSSRTGMTNADVAQKEGYDVYSFNHQLERLIAKRNEIMSQPIKDREIKFFRSNPNQSVSQVQQQISELPDYEELQPNQDATLMNFLKQIAQSLEEQSFASKRRKEYDQLFSKQIYSETLIRVKLPGDLLFEAKFSPLERLQNLLELLKEYLTGDFYLYTTPPVVKMVQRHLVQTFDDLESVPNGLFFLGGEFQLKQNVRIIDL